jgi:hypothetical protein
MGPWLSAVAEINWKVRSSDFTPFGTSTLKADTSVRLQEMRRHQVYRLDRPRSRSLFKRLSRGLRARFAR